MANLTLTIDDDVLRRARIKATREGTSVNAVVRDHLERFAGEAPAIQAIDRFLAATETATSGSGPEGRTWTREDLYDERLNRYG